MTWSRRVCRGGDGARSLGWDVVAAGSAGFVDEVLFAPQLGQAVAGLADGVAAVIDTREGVHLGNELGDGEPVRRWRQRQGGAQRVSHAAFVEVDTADPVLTRMATGRQSHPSHRAPDHRYDRRTGASLVGSSRRLAARRWATRLLRWSRLFS
jgi:hypothetical protein